MTESEIQHAVRLALGREPDFRLFRNNTGTAHHADGRHTRYGLAKGSSDLIGILRIDPPVTPYPIGRFLSLEVKTPTGRATPEQLQWLALVRNLGGFACIVRSVDDACAALDRARRGLSE